MKALSLAVGATMAAGALASVPAVHATEAHAAQRLIVAPAITHPAGLVYLSGAGFRASRSIGVGFRCTGTETGRAVLGGLSPAQTDAHGQFVAYALPLQRITARQGTCHLTAGLAATTLTIVPSSVSLPLCARTMCMSVHAFVQRLPQGAQGTIHIQGWPGATADVAVSYPGAGAKRAHVQLGWRGESTIRMIVAPGLQKASQAVITARARLGSFPGVASTRFVIIPGGR